MSETTGGCAFLSDKGRCTIHGYRPGICRIFPLGRYYENHSFHYILQTNECKNSSNTKMKVGKWIDTKNVDENEQYITTWHYFLNDVESIIKKLTDDNQIKNINMYLLHNFYLKGYLADTDFYTQFYNRLTEVKRALNLQ
jgi:Fe-S-cluster containining protein